MVLFTNSLSINVYFSPTSDRDRLVCIYIYVSGEQTCPCVKGDQKTEHIIYDCDRLKEERDRLRAAVNKADDWPTSKRNLITRHYKEFSKFINSISFEELNAEGN
jgi:hypothetical protein